MFEDRIHFCGKGYYIPSDVNSYDDEEVIVFHNDIQEDPKLKRENDRKYRRHKRKHKRSY